MKNLKYIALVFLLFLSACTAKVPQPTETAPFAIEATQVNEEELARERFDAMINESVKAYPFIMQGSVRLGEEGKTYRASYLMWGNESFPYRLELSIASSPLFQAYEDSKGVLLYIPRDNVVHYYNSLQRAFEAFQIAFPFNAEDIVALTQGNFAHGFKDIDYVSSVYNAKENRVSYTIPFSQKSSNLFYGTWVLDKFARPLSWAQKDWFLEFEYDEENSMDRSPSKISGINLSNQIFTLFIKELSKTDSYSLEKMQLDLPKDVKALY